MDFKTWYNEKFHPTEDDDIMLYSYEIDIIYDLYIKECKEKGIMFQKRNEI
jgi:hypothetical protein